MDHGLKNDLIYKVIRHFIKEVGILLTNGLWIVDHFMKIINLNLNLQRFVVSELYLYVKVICK